MGLAYVFVLTACSGSDSEPSPAPSDLPPETSAEQDEPSTPLETELPSLLPYVTCMQERGWQVEYDEASGGVSSGLVPYGQEAQYNEDDEECRDEYWPPDSRDLTAEEWAVVYDALIELRTCLIEAGAPITEDAPSESSFIDEAMMGNGNWTPYLELDHLTGDEYLRLEVACPHPLFYAAPE